MWFFFFFSIFPANLSQSGKIRIFLPSSCSSLEVCTFALISPTLTLHSTKICLCMHPLSHVWLFTTPWTVGSYVHGILQARSGLPFPSPGDLPNPGAEPMSLTSPALVGKFFTASATWEVENLFSDKIELVKMAFNRKNDSWLPPPPLALSISSLAKTSTPTYDLTRGCRQELCLQSLCSQPALVNLEGGGRESMLKSRVMKYGRRQLSFKELAKHVFEIFIYNSSADKSTWSTWTVIVYINMSPLDCKDIQPINPKGNQS